MFSRVVVTRRGNGGIAVDCKRGEEKRMCAWLIAILKTVMVSLNFVIISAEEK